MAALPIICVDRSLLELLVLFVFITAALIYFY